MFARVVNGGTLSEPFNDGNDTKQGCVLTPLMFSISYAAMLLDKGIQIQYRTNGGTFCIQRLRAKIKVINLLARGFFFADDCALTPNALADAQEIVSCLTNSASRLFWSIN